MTTGTGDRRIGAALARLLAGAIAGAAATAGFLGLFGGPIFANGGPGAGVAIAAGLSYLLMGLFVGSASIAPAPGFKLLNVADEEELREERPKLMASAIACILTGGVLLAIPATGAAAGSARTLLLVTAFICATGVILVTLWCRTLYDELTRQVGFEASAFTLSATLLLFGGWAAFAQLGYVAWTTPLTFLGGIALIYLFAIFWVSGKRGLLNRRR